MLQMSGSSKYSAHGERATVLWLNLCMKALLKKATVNYSMVISNLKIKCINNIEKMYIRKVDLIVGEILYLALVVRKQENIFILLVSNNTFSSSPKQLETHLQKVLAKQPSWNLLFFYIPTHYLYRIVIWIKCIFAGNIKSFTCSFLEN